MSNSPLLKLVLSTFLTLAIIAGCPTIALCKENGRYNRITVGTVEVKDWHKGIVRSYPNLRHYHWNPMYSNVQGWNKVKPPRHSIKGKVPRSTTKHGNSAVKRKIDPKYVKFIPTQKRPKFVYKKPERLPMHGKNVAFKSSYTNTKVGYIHVNPPVREFKTQSQLAHKTTQPALRHRGNELAFSSTKPERATNLSLTRQKTKASLASKNTNIQLSNNDINARLNTKEVQASLVEKEPVVMSYKPYKTSNKGMSNYSSTRTRVEGKIAY